MNKQRLFKKVLGEVEVFSLAFLWVYSIVWMFFLPFGVGRNWFYFSKPIYGIPTPITLWILTSISYFLFGYFPKFLRESWKLRVMSRSFKLSKEMEILFRECEERREEIREMWCDLGFQGKVVKTFEVFPGKVIFSVAKTRGFESFSLSTIEGEKEIADEVKKLAQAMNFYWKEEDRVFVFNNVIGHDLFLFYVGCCKSPLVSKKA